MQKSTERFANDNLVTRDTINARGIDLIHRYSLDLFHRLSLSSPGLLSFNELYIESFFFFLSLCDVNIAWLYNNAIFKIFTIFTTFMQEFHEPEQYLSFTKKLRTKKKKKNRKDREIPARILCILQIFSQTVS